MAQGEAPDGENGGGGLVERGDVDGKRFIELQTFEAGQSFEDFEDLSKVGAMVGRHMGNGEVYEVALEERR